MADKGKAVVLVQHDLGPAMVKGPFRSMKAAEDWARVRNDDPRYEHTYTALWLYRAT